MSQEERDAALVQLRALLSRLPPAERPKTLLGLTGDHWTVISLFLSGLGVQLGTAKSWSDVLTISFAAGLCLQGAALMRSIYTERPPPAK